jgi:hypothetical protein
MNITWIKKFLQVGKKNNFILWMIAIVFSGIGSFFINPFHEVKYFEERVTFNRNIINTFYEKNNSLYLIKLGSFKEAEKIGLIPSPKEIQEVIENLHNFKTNNKFDKEKFKEYLKKHKVTENDVYIYAYREASVIILNKLFNNYPLKFQNLNIKKIKSIQSISGDQLYLKKNEEVSYTPSSSELKNFITNTVKDQDILIQVPEKRSGIILEIKNTKSNATNLNKILIEKNILFTQLDVGQIKYLLKEVSPSIEFKEYNFSLTEKNESLSSLLFKDKLEFIEYEENIYFPILQDLQCKGVKPFNEDTMKDVTLLCKGYYENIYNKIKLENLSRQYNNKEITFEHLLSKCQLRKFKKNFNDSHNVKLETLLPNTCCVILDHNNIPSIVVLRSKAEGVPEENYYTMFLRESLKNPKNLTETYLNNFFSYFINTAN